MAVLLQGPLEWALPVHLRPQLDHTVDNTVDNKRPMLHCNLAGLAREPLVGFLVAVVLDTADHIVAMVVVAARMVVAEADHKVVAVEAVDCMHCNRHIPTVVAVVAAVVAFRVGFVEPGLRTE